MKARTWLFLLFLGCGADAALAATSTAPASSRPAVSKPATKRASSTAPSTATKTKPSATQDKSAAASSHKPVAGANKAAGREGPRTLQDIHIEGEIPVPQVLFITARDQRRFLDFQHRRYLRTSQQVGEQTALPSWIGVTGQQPTDERKENPR